MKPSVSESGRRIAWAVGVVVCLGYYAVKTTRWARTTAVGRETPIFPRWGVEVAPLQSPGGRWALSVEPAFSSKPFPFSAAPVPVPPGWPPPINSPRRVTILQPFGTWEARSGLHRLWRFPSVGWSGEHRLRAEMSVDGDEPELWLDLHTGRTSWRKYSDHQSRDETYESDLYEEEPDMLAVLNSTLENGDTKVEFSKQKHYQVGERRLYLLWSPWAKGKRHPILAASDEAAPRQVRLVDDGVPIELGKDGRTLWFSRGNMLWRLDFRKPLPELLDQAPLPKLPEPPLD